MKKKIDSSALVPESRFRNLIKRETLKYYFTVFLIFFVAPMFFAIGTWKDKAEAVKVTDVTFEISGKVIEKKCFSWKWLLF